MNETFIFNQIRRYNQARRQIHKDAALTAIGLHAGLLKKKRVVLRELSPDERISVLAFLREFLKKQGVDVVIE